MLSPLLYVLGHPRCYGAALRILYASIRYFFFPQFETRFRPKTRPVVNVDHPLDLEVPFRPELVGEYLTFFFLWIDTALFMAREFPGDGPGRFKAHIDEAAQLYRLCGKVYLKRQSTTDRPSEAANGGFALIHGVDPHLHCIPSLHVLLVVGNWILARREWGGSGGLKEVRALAYLRQEAIRITESILFVKQHSINCVGVSLFFLRARYPDFDALEVERFIAALFSYEGAQMACAQALRDYSFKVYARLWSAYEKRGQCGWDKVVLAFLEEFKPRPPF